VLYRLPHNHLFVGNQSYHSAPKSDEENSIKRKTKRLFALVICAFPNQWEIKTPF
jgi:hypothetical protein